jgi:hypothetical protein
MIPLQFLFLFSVHIELFSLVVVQSGTEVSLTLPLASPIGCQPFTVFDSMVGVGLSHSAAVSGEKEVKLRMQFSVRVDGVQVWQSPEINDIKDTHRVQVHLTHEYIYIYICKLRFVSFF